MKKTLASVFSLGCLVASMASASAFADDSAAAKASGLVTDNAIVSLTAQVESRYSLIDSAYANQFHFFNQVARMGVNINYGRVNAKILGQFNSLNANGEMSSSRAPGQYGAFGVREAWMSYSIMKKVGKYELNTQFGRFVPNGATAYGSDAVKSYWAGVGNFESTDGLVFNMSGTEGVVNYAVQVGAASALPVWAFGPIGSYDTFNTSTVTLATTDVNFGGAPTNKEMAFIANGQASLDLGHELKPEVALAYGSRAKTFIDSVDEVGLIRGDESYLEASAGLRYKSFALGGWYSQLAFTNNKQFTGETSYNADNIAAATPVDYGEVRDVAYGIGVQGDSTLFGMEDFFSKGDSLIFGLGLQWMSQPSPVNANESGNSSMMSSVTAGYQNGVFQASLNYAYFKSDRSVFTSSDQANNNDVGQRAYVMTSIAL